MTQLLDSTVAGLQGTDPADHLRREHRHALDRRRGADDAFDSSPYGVATFDEWGRCTRANLAWATLGPDLAGILRRCAVFADRLSLLVLRQLRQEPGRESEIRAAARLLAAMRRSLLTLEDQRA